jgi:hypothetical protein
MARRVNNESGRVLLTQSPVHGWSAEAGRRTIVRRAMALGGAPLLWF